MTQESFAHVTVTLAPPQNAVPDDEYTEGDLSYPQSDCLQAMEMVQATLEKEYPGIVVERSDDPGSEGVKVHSTSKSVEEMANVSGLRMDIRVRLRDVWSDALEAVYRETP